MFFKIIFIGNFPFSKLLVSVKTTKCEEENLDSFVESPPYSARMESLAGKQACKPQSYASFETLRI